MFQCNEHVEMNKFLCSLACTWMTILDSQFYIIDSLSLDVSFGGCLVVRYCLLDVLTRSLLNRYSYGGQLMRF